jgi:hypothetical protein
MVSRCESNQRAITYTSHAPNAAQMTVVPAPKGIEPPKTSARRVIGSPAKRSSKHSIAGTSAKLAAIVDKKSTIRWRTENAV